MSEVERWAAGGRIAILRSMLGELDRLVKANVPGAPAARALARRFPCLDAPSSGDAGILAAARSRGAIVVTADRALADRLVAQGSDVLVPRDRARLELVRGRPSRAHAPARRRRD